MTTPLIIVSILFVPTLVAALLGVALRKPDLYRIGGRVGLAVAFAFFSVGHFAMTEPMIAMLPDWVPYRRPIVLSTGLLEAGLAVALLVPRLRKPAGLVCIAVLFVFFPANVYAAMNSVGPGGHQWGPMYLLVRAPLQLLLVAWAYWFAVRTADYDQKRS